jgi:hypothetical protein
MKGALHVIPAKTGAPHRFRFLSKPPTHRELIELLGPDIELIPDLETVHQNGELRSCQAFAAFERGLEAHRNQWATVLFKLSLVEKYGPSHPDPEHVIRGDVVVVSGDPEFLSAL